MDSIEELEEILSRPSAELVAELATLPGDIIILGAGGKLGPNITRMAIRARAGRTDGDIIAVSRFSNLARAESLAAAGARIIVCDLLESGSVEQLPEAANVIYLVSARFNMTGREDEMWLSNAHLPSRVMERYRSSRVVALSSGNVYPMLPVTGRGASETTPPAPVGEYGMSCLARERLMAAFSRRNQTALALLRLNYAVEMRYGPLVDIARAVAGGQPVPLAMGHLNAVWQGYANDVILRCLARASSPPFLLNVAGPETISVRAIARRLGSRLDREVEFEGDEAETALLSDARRCHALFGHPTLALDEIVENTAAWIRKGLPLFSHQSGFQQRNGKF